MTLVFSLRRFLVCAFMLVGLSHCATYQGSSERASYRSYLRHNLQEAIRYEAMRPIVHGRFLPVTAALEQQQKALVPGFERKHLPTGTELVVALSFSSNDYVGVSELSFFLNGLRASSVKEEQSKALIETLYPFAYPFQRLFYVRFEGVLDHRLEGQATVEVHSPQGALRKELKLAAVL